MARLRHFALVVRDLEKSARFYEEVFFVLQGRLMVFFEEEDGRRIEVALGPWDCVSCPPGVIHGYRNDTVEPVYVQVMAGKAQPELMGYADPTLFANRDAHTRRNA